MKKLILTSVCALAVTAGAYAQGLVNWGSISFANVTAQTNATVRSVFTPAGPLSGTAAGVTASPANGGAFYYTLLYSAWTGSQAAAPTTFAQLTAWSSSGLYATNGNTAGRLAVMTPNSGAPVAAFTPGVTNNIMLVGWSANIGTLAGGQTWAQVSSLLNNWATQGASVVGNAFLGITPIGYIATVDTTTSPGVGPFGSAAQTYGVPIQSLNTQLNELTIVPEPGTLALAALGGASLLLFRRRK
jgi:hypothetical protein